MATSLAAQLAQIAAQSKNSLNTKAQKAAHAKSLIFEPQVAAGQSYQAVYTLCHEGFEELCELDARFAPYGATLFSQESQDQDRTQMTAAENAELDRKIEGFLRLVGGRLRLMPAIKAVEWLVRRFRIHEENTAALLTTFLPYHALPAFVTLMSILPAALPQDYAFLSPYVRSLTPPPRAAIVRQATHHFGFTAALSAYVLDACRAQQHYPALVSFWAGVVTEAVSGMLDRMRSGRKSIQRDNDQTVLQQLAPILGDALVMRKVPGLQVASYMVVAVLASKGDLDDVALSAFMDQLVLGWTAESLRPGLVCLSILAQYRSAKQLSGKVTKALLKIQDLPRLLVEMGREHRVDRLGNGLSLALVDRLSKKGDTRGLATVEAILLGRILPEKQAVVIFKSLLVAAHKITDDADPDGQARRQVGLVLVRLSQASGASGAVFRQVIEDTSLDLEELELRLDTSIRPLRALEGPGEDAAVGDAREDGGAREDVESALARLSKTTHAAASCLSRDADTLFEEVCELFFSVASHDDALARFDEAPLLHRAAAPSDCFYLTFCMRVWTGPYPILARARALELAKGRLKQDDFSDVDVQAVLPYCVAALGDPAKRVRRAAADLITVVRSQRGEKPSKGKTPWGSGRLYQKADDLKWLSPEAAHALLDDILLPALEEAILHEDHVSAVIKTALESSSKSPAADAEAAKKAHISHAARLSILAFLASHVLQTPLLRPKLALLKALNQVKGVSGTTRTQLLLPLLRWWAGLAPQEASQLARREAVEEPDLDAAFVDVVVPNDKDGIECLFEIVGRPAERPALARAVFLRVRKMWPAMKSEAKFVTARQMLDLSQQQAPSGGDVVAEEAADLLRNVELTTDILLAFLDSLQDTAKMATEPPANKRRRTSSSDHHRGAAVQSSPELGAALRRVTFVLQLVESSDPAEHPQLLQSLFMTLSDLQLLRTVVGSELGYLQHLVLGSLLAMMPAYKRDRGLKIDTSVGHGDVLVACIQKSSSPAVQNAALLLVASLAQTAPGVVLHSVMPIFTFMGSSVLRQSDDYSAHVITQTIREVVPPLIDTFRKGRRNIVDSASELLSSFVIAYEHVPSHRKHDLFISLTENLGPRDFLFALVAMFADKYGTADDILSFCAELMNSFNAEVQLQTLVRFLGLVSDVLKPKPALSAAVFGRTDGDDDVSKTALKQLTLLPYLLANRTLKSEIGKLAERDDMETSKVRELYAQLLEELLALADAVKPRRALHAKCGDALANLLNLLSVGEFIKSVETLLDRPNVGLRQKVLRALEVRVDRESTADPASRAALLAFLPQLTAVIRDSDDIQYKHTAVSCVDKISEKYGKKDLEAVAAAAATIAGDRCLGQDDPRLRVMALLCLASLVDVLQDGIVPVLPLATPKALDYIALSLEGDRPDRELHNAAYAFVTSLAQHLPYMLSGSSLDRLLAISSRSAQAGLDDESDENRRQCLRFLAKRLDGKVLFAALQSNWRNAAEAGYSAVAEFIDILGLGIDKHSKAAVARNVDALSATFLGILDLRRQELSRGHTSGPALARLAELEAAGNDVALRMIYKLNDAAFRPVFARVMEWSSALPRRDAAGLAARRFSVYGLLLAFFGGLKSIVTGYATYVVDSAAGILAEADPAAAEGRALWRRVLQTLARCFEHDQDDFWQAPAHFAAVAPVLAAQLLHAPALDVAGDLVPAVVELAAAADSQDHQRELNAAVLRHLRSESAAVRLAAVRCEQALTDRLGEEWLAMLPEMLPYISELQEDDDEAVERETHRWIVKIEAVLGESLDSMLQ